MTNFEALEQAIRHIINVHFHAVERTLKKIQRGDGNTLKTIWEA